MKISSAAIFPKLRMILNEDIKVLEQIKRNKMQDSDICDLANSLIESKYKILDKFPANFLNSTYAKSVSNELTIVRYRKQMKEDQRRLISALKNLEEEQMKLVKDSLAEENLPEELKDSLEDILAIYTSITMQLNRAYKTNQFNSILV